MTKPEPWSCRNLLCRDGSRWWRSTHAVINCANCCPPSFPDLVAATGVVAEALAVHEGYGTTPIDVPIGERAPAAVAAAKAKAKAKKRKGAN